MSLLHNHAGLVSVRVPWMAADKSDTPAQVIGPRNQFVTDLVERYGRAATAEPAMRPVFRQFFTPDTVTPGKSPLPGSLMDATEKGQLEGGNDRT